MKWTLLKWGTRIGTSGDRDSLLGDRKGHGEMEVVSPEGTSSVECVVAHEFDTGGREDLAGMVEKGHEEQRFPPW